MHTFVKMEYIYQMGYISNQLGHILCKSKSNGIHYYIVIHNINYTYTYKID